MALASTPEERAALREAQMKHQGITPEYAGGRKVAKRAAARQKAAAQRARHRKK